MGRKKRRSGVQQFIQQITIVAVSIVMEPKMLLFESFVLITEIAVESLGISFYRNSIGKFSGAVDSISVFFISL